MFTWLKIILCVFAGNDPVSDLQSSLYEGYDETPFSEVESLNKALQAQEGVTDIAALRDGGALQLQSLETQLALLTFQEKHIKFFKDIGIQKAYSTLEEYSVQDSYGTEGGFVGQMENPEEGDPGFQRKFAVVKFMRALWKTSDVLGLVNQISNAEVLAVQSAILRIMRGMERGLFYSDSDMIPSAYDGIIKTVKANATVDHVRDLRGGSITEAEMRVGAEIIAGNFGIPTKMYTSFGVQTAIDSLINTNPSAANNIRLVLNDVKGDGLISMGHGINAMRTSFGNYLLEPDLFLSQESWDVPKIKDPSNPSTLIEGPTSAKSPATPSFTLTVNAPVVVGSLWKASGDGGAVAGLYNYRVVAKNQFGKSAAAVAKSDTVAATGSITVAITSGGGAYAPTAYEIYRETYPSSGILRYLTEVKASVGSYEDKNEYLSGTSVAVLVDNTTVGEMRTMALSQLAPIHKVQYAKIAPYKWGTVNLYAVPKWYAPLRFVVYKNIGVSRQYQNPVIEI